MTTTTPDEKKEKPKKWMAKTARPKNVVIDGKAYIKCSYPDCGCMVEDWGYGNRLGVMYDHIRKVHELVWLRKGKTAGWWPLSKFYHPKQEKEEEK